MRPTISRTFRWFSTLPIRYKMLLSYSVVFFLSLTLGSAILYSFVRRTIESNIESELKNSTATILSMVRTAANVSIKNHLRAVAEKNREIAEYYYEQARQGRISENAAQEAARNVFLSQTIGKTGYIYCLDSNGIIRIHPKESLLGVDLSEHAFIMEQQREKVGYLEYDWKNPGESAARPKALYMTYFAPWDWIISASSYRSEFNELVNPDDFRQSILSLQFGKTGYSFVLDTVGTLIIHPTSKGNYYDAIDSKGRMFIQDICAQKNGKIFYTWINPGETEPREKLVIFNEIPEFNWIVASSSYVDEFYAPLKTIQRIFIATVLISLMLVLSLTFRISASITNPLRELMKRLSAGAKGDIVDSTAAHSADEIGLLATYFNQFITEVRASEHETNRMRLYLQNVIDSMPSILIGVDLNGLITQWNREAEHVTGIPSGSALGKHVLSIIPSLKILKSVFRQAIADRTPKKIEKTAYPINQASRYADLLVYPLLVNGMEGAVIRVDDVTARVRMEEIMVQSEKMLSVGGLAAGMAHEINNPLGGILQSLQNIQRRLTPDLTANIRVATDCGTDIEAVRRYLERREILKFLESIRNAGERAGATVEDMLTFSRRSESRAAPVDIVSLLEKTVELATHDYNLKKKYDFRQIKIAREYSPDLGVVTCVATEIEQVILNLLRNAAQAMASSRAISPVITLRTRLETDTAVIEVADNGPGMSEEISKRVFEPFFTTKEVGIGTGLGLSVSYFIITSNHHGTMSVDSSPGNGTCFLIRLPLRR